jgi:hypothetical protein
VLDGAAASPGWAGDDEQPAATIATPADINNAVVTRVRRPPRAPLVDDRAGNLMTSTLAGARTDCAADLVSCQR